MSVTLRDQLTMNSHSSLKQLMSAKEQFGIKRILRLGLFNQNDETQIRERERLGIYGKKKGEENSPVTISYLGPPHAMQIV